MGRLSEFVRETSGVAFLGAGASLDSGLPLGDQAATGIIRACFRAAGLLRIFRDLERHRTSGPVAWPRFEVVLGFLEEYLPGTAAEILGTFNHIGVSAVHQQLAENFKGHWLWLTTNFDDQIERALTASGANCIVLRSRRQIPQIPKLLADRHVVVKLHGDEASHPTEVGVTIHQILRTFPVSLARCLARAATGKPVLFVGYAARDPDLTSVVEGLVQKAAKLVWIGKGRMTPRIKAQLRHRLPESPYYGRGAEAAFHCEWKIKLPAPRKSNAWTDQVNAWAQSKARDRDGLRRLHHFLAALCISRDSSPCRIATQKILKHVATRGEPFRRWNLGHQLRLLEQTPLAASGSLVKSLKHWEGALGPNAYRQTPEARSECYCVISQYFRKHGNYSKSRQLAERALNVLPTRSISRQRVNALRTLGLAHVYCSGRWLKTGCAILRSAQQLSKQIAEPVLAAQATEELAFGYLRANKPRLAIKLLNRARPTYEEVGDPRLMISFERNMAESMRATGHLDKALSLNQRALAYALMLDDYEGRRKATNNLALCQVENGEILEADRALMDCVSEAHRRGRLEYQTDPAANRAWVRLLIGDWGEALRLLERVVALELKRGSDDRAVGALCERGWCQLCLDRRDDARRTLERIDADGIVPAGPPRGYYIMLKLALGENGSAAAAFVKRTGRLLIDFPEQRFFALIWFLESAETSIAEQRLLIRECWTSLKKADQPALASLLDHVIRRRCFPVRLTLREAIRSFSAGPYRRLREGLRTQAKVIRGLPKVHT
jgi:tetratricopeptide (TPR) repeat protein